MMTNELKVTYKFLCSLGRALLKTGTEWNGMERNGIYRNAGMKRNG